MTIVVINTNWDRVRLRLADRKLIELVFYVLPFLLLPLLTKILVEFAE